MSSQNPYKKCPGCRQLILENCQFCPNCSLRQPEPATMGEILAYFTLGSMVVGGMAGMFFGWMMGNPGVKFWGDLIGNLTGQGRWAINGLRPSLPTARGGVSWPACCSGAGPSSPGRGTF